MKLTKQEMASVLRAAAQHIEADDSFEGAIGWVAAPGGFYAFGCYRYGNRDGQGCVALLGDEQEAREGSDREFDAALAARRMP